MRDEEGDPIPPIPTSSDRGPAKWAAVGILAGAAAVGLAWVTLGRAPGPAPILAAPTPTNITSPAPSQAPNPGAAEPRPIIYLLAEATTPSTAGPAPAAGPPTLSPAPADVTLPTSPSPPAAGGTPVPPAPPTNPTPAPTPEPGKTAAKINLNTATVEEVDLLPGVGRATAQAILEYRTKHGKFRTVSELDKVPGIGPAKLDRLRPLVRTD